MTDTNIDEPTIDWLIDEIAPNEGNSPLVNFNKKRLKAQIKQLITEARIDELKSLPKSEIGKLANHSLAVDIHVQDRLAALQREE